jgi:hypothetical protein
MWLPPETNIDLSIRFLWSHDTVVNYTGRRAAYEWVRNWESGERVFWCVLNTIVTLREQQYPRALSDKHHRRYRTVLTTAVRPTVGVQLLRRALRSGQTTSVLFVRPSVLV